MKASEYFHVCKDLHFISVLRKVMFSYPIHHKRHRPYQKNSIIQKAFNVDYEEFRKSIGLYIRNTRTLDVNQEADLRAMIRNIRRDVKEDPEDKMDTSYETEDSFLSAYGDNDENDPGDDTLSATSRKTLALNLMKVFREDVPKLAVLQRNHYVRTTLSYLRIGENEWKNFHVST